MGLLRLWNTYCGTLMGSCASLRTSEENFRRHDRALQKSQGGAQDVWNGEIHAVTQRRMESTAKATILCDAIYGGSRTKMRYLVQIGRRCNHRLQTVETVALFPNLNARR